MKNGFLLRLKNGIRRWLGFDDMFIGVDVGIGESSVVIVSKLKEGSVKIIDVKFGNYKELKYFIRETQQRYGVPDNGVICDMPMGYKPII